MSPYSYSDFTGIDLSDREDMSDQVIICSCFSQEQPRSRILPSNLYSAVFRDCNLDNVYVPEGIVLINCSNRQFQVQSDGLDWEVDEHGTPIRPLNE